VIGPGSVARVHKLWEAAAGGSGTAVAVDRALGRVAYSNGQGILLYDLGTGKPTDADVNTCSPVLRGGLAYAGNRLVIVCQGSVRVRVGRETATTALAIVAAPVTAASIAADRVALAHRDGVVRIYPLDGGAPTEIPVPGPPIDVKSLALSADGTRVAVAWVQGSIWWWDLSAPATPHDLVRHDRESDTVAWSRDGRQLAEEGESFHTTVWSFAAEPATTATLRNGSWIKRLLFTEDGGWLVRGGSDGLELAEIAGPKRIVLDDRGAVEDVAMSADGTTLAAADREGRLTVWSTR
jgi:WD40 repeat protein